MDKRKFIFTTAITIFILINAISLSKNAIDRWYITTRSDYHIENEIIPMEITNKKAISQGIISKLFYTNNEMEYYFTISDKSYKVNKKIYDKFDIGDYVDMEITVEYIGKEKYKTHIEGVRRIDDAELN